MSGSVKNIVIGGGTGNIGRYLVPCLVKAGHNVSVISRNAKILNKGSRFAPNDKKNHVPNTFLSWKDIQMDGLPLDTDVVINLSGKTIGQPGPWVESLKKTILHSRIDTTKQLVRAIEKSEVPPKVFISASAVGIYSLDPAKVYTESDPPAKEGKSSFFTRLCQDWEKSSIVSEGVSTRVVNPRFGVVLAHDTDPMRMLLKSGITDLNIIIGSGKQPFPWIHIEDTTRILEQMMEDDKLSGPVNCVAPHIVDNSQFTHAIAKACHSRVQKPNLPEFMVRLMYGTERADNILLDSPRVAPQTLIDMGYEFRHPDIDSAMEALVDAVAHEPGFFSKLLEKRRGKAHAS